MNQPVIHRPSYGGVNATHCWPGSNYCGVVSWNGWFRLYDLGRREFVQEFNVPDTGGMSAAVSADDRFLFLGTYYAWGLACIEIATRRFVWRRKELKKFYGLCFSPSDGCLYAEFDGASAIKIDSQTGETKAKLLRVKEVAASPHGDYVLASEATGLCLRDTSGNTLHKWPAIVGFAIFGVAWSPRTVAIVECISERDIQEKSGTRAFDLQSGALVWQQPSKGTYPDGIMFRPEGEYVGIERRLGDSVLVRLDEQTGTIQHQTIPIARLKCAACGRGTFVCHVCGRGSLVFAMDVNTHETHLFRIGDSVEGVHEA